MKKTRPIADENKKAPIIIEYAGGLGNQLFQYSFAQYLRIRTGRTLYFDITAVERDIKRDPIILKFGIDTSNIIRSRRQLFVMLGERILTSLSTIEKVIHRIFPYKKPEEAKSFFIIDDDIVSKEFLSNAKQIDISLYAEHIINLIEKNSKKPIYIRGYWQYAWFLLEIIQLDKNYQLNHEFLLSLPTREETRKEFREEIEKIKNNAATCSLHIRRGDYLEADVLTMLPPLDPSYYVQAIQHILHHNMQVTFYIFSDDAKWCEDNLSELFAGVLREEQFIIASERISKTAIEDIVLMSICHHHILANSSFSWWGAMIDKLLEFDYAKKEIKKEIKSKDISTHKRAEKKISIAPRKWFSDEAKNSVIRVQDWVIF